MGDLLDQIEGTLRQYEGIARKSRVEGEHEQLEQINASLENISTYVKGLNTKGDHSAAYKQIEKSLQDMVDAVHQLAAGARP